MTCPSFQISFVGDFHSRVAIMFNPNNAATAKAEKLAKKKALAELKTQSEALIPQELHEGMN